MKIKFLILFHGLSKYLKEKGKIVGRHAKYLSGGLNLTPSPVISYIILYKKLRTDHLDHCDDAI